MKLSAKLTFNFSTKNVVKFIHYFGEFNDEEDSSFTLISENN